MNYYLDAWYVLKEKLWWINKQPLKSIGCFTLQGILSLAFDTISAAGKDSQSSECWSIARRSKTSAERQPRKSLHELVELKKSSPSLCNPCMRAGKLCPHFFGPSMINKWSLEHLYSYSHAIKNFLKNNWRQWISKGTSKGQQWGRTAEWATFNCVSKVKAKQLVKNQRSVFF